MSKQRNWFLSDWLVLFFINWFFKGKISWSCWSSSHQ